MTEGQWTPTRALPPERFLRARLELHAGAILLASAAESLLPHRDDDSHGNLGIHTPSESLETRVFDRLVETRLRLEAVEGRLAWIQGEWVDRLELSGRTWADALAWIEERARDALAANGTLARRDYPGLPAIEVLDDRVPFPEVDTEARTAVFAWFHSADRLIEALRKEHPSLSEVRVWPHHFDLGALLPLPGPSTDIESPGARLIAPGARLIGLGMSPGDESSPDPYFYCSPYPQPGPTAELPPLRAGRWRRGTPTMVWLPAAQLYDTDDFEARVGLYLREAIDASRVVLA